MKNTIISIVICLISIPLFSQNKHAVRVGLGMNFFIPTSNEYKNDNGSIGPTFFLEYQYNINKYIAANINLMPNHNKFSDNTESFFLNVNTGIIYTPFPNKFRYVKIGYNAGYSRLHDFYGNYNTSDELFYKSYKSNNWGMTALLRMYAIDTEKFELFANWNYNLRSYYGRTLHFFSNDFGIFFGVKF